MEHTNKIRRLHLEACAKELRNHHIKTDVFETMEEVKAFLNEQIEDGAHVGDGGSMTLKYSGIIDMLNQRDIDYITHNQVLDRETAEAKNRRVFSADYFLTSANAITMNGEIINVDGHGNRVAAMIFGPKKVFIVAGYNKIVKDEEAAKTRIQTIAAPINCVRLNRNTPCVIKGSCQDCRSNERICAAYVKINFDREDRLHVLLVNEEHGY